MGFILFIHMRMGQKNTSKLSLYFSQYDALFHGGITIE